MKRNNNFTSHFSNGATSLDVAIEKFVEADNRYYMESMALEESIRSGVGFSSSQLRKSETAGNELHAKLAKVSDEAASCYLDVLKKLHLWSRITCCNDPADQNHSLPDRLVASSVKDLENLLKQA